MADVSIGNDLEPVVASEPSLRRVMGPWLLLLFIVGDILGTGFTRSPARLLNRSAAPWLPFLLAFVVALITALSYLELVTKYPRRPGPRSIRTRHSAFTS